jgi:cysteine synthase A
VVLADTEEGALRQIEAELRRTSDYRGGAIPHGCLVEEFMVGMECSVELLVVDGEVVVLGVTDKPTGPLPTFIEVGVSFPSCFHPAEIDRITQVAANAISAIGFNFGVAHVELKVTSQGPRVIEINPRIGGDPIPTLVKLATDQDYMETALRLYAGLDVSQAVQNLRQVKRGAACRLILPKSAGSCVNVRGLDLAARVPGVVSATCVSSPKRDLRMPEDNTDWLGMIVSTGRTSCEAARSAEAAHALVQVDTSDT